MLSLLFNVIALILHFDGSLRVPHDPRPDIIPHSVSCKFLPPMASCSSVLLRDEFDMEKDYDITSEKWKESEMILALDGKILDGFGLTSADVEYEGLLLGMKLLMVYLEGLTSTEIMMSCNTITVRGDCKTAIDQMNAVSKPRKQKDYFERVHSLVDEIKINFNIIFIFEHVLRDQNELCDAVCHDVIQLHQASIVGEVEQQLDDIVAKKPLLLPQSKKKRAKFMDTHFSTLIDDLRDWDQGRRSRVPLSMRPYFLGKIALYANQVGDYVAMRLVGEALINESKQWQKQGLSFGKYASFSDALNELGQMLVLFSLDSMDLRQSAVMKMALRRADKIDLKLSPITRKEVIGCIGHFVNSRVL